MRTTHDVSLALLAERYVALLDKHYTPGFGISPASEPSENFYRQVWTRDFAHAVAHYFNTQLPQAVEDSIATILHNQRKDGALPLRVEKEYLLLKLIPLLRKLARPAFILFEEVRRGRNERPVYPGQDFSAAKDTIPAFLVAVGMFSESSDRGHFFMRQHTSEIVKACRYILPMCDRHDGLLSVSRGNVDWADSIVRGGKLGLLNVLWVRSLELLSELGVGKGALEADSERSKRALTDMFYDREGAYVRATTGEERLDTVASVLYALFFLEPEECVRVEETLARRVLWPSGLKNFDPPYPSSSILWPFRLIGHQRYHNSYVWPWVTLQNIHVKIKIAQKHPEMNVQKRFRKEAVADLVNIADLFEASDGAYEIYFPDDRRPAKSLLYSPPRHLMANLASFMSVYRKLLTLGWITALD